MILSESTFSFQTDSPSVMGIQQSPLWNQTYNYETTSPPIKFTTLHSKFMLVKTAFILKPLVDLLSYVSSDCGYVESSWIL